MVRMIELSDQKAALLALTIVALVAAFTGGECKDVLLAISTGIVGWMSKRSINAEK